jgi:3-hydroxyisobutyrate dehydrogenase-like beta-hydroxyacid dehydrogenase
MSKTKVAFLGTGLMGLPMATNLLKAGFEVTAWNRTRSKSESLLEFGAVIADTASRAVEGADFVITMLESGPVVTEVLMNDGLLDSLKDGAVVLDMSSIPPETARSHSDRLADMNIGHMDAPVSGGVAGASAGTLAIMAGGEPDIFEQSTDVFAAMGRSTYVGPSGAGQVSKLANQVIVGITIGAVSEALLLASQAGADPAAVREALSGGYADSLILNIHGDRMIKRDFRKSGSVRVQLKDLSSAIELARSSGLNLPLVSMVYDGFAALAENGYGEYDHSGLVLALEAMNEGKRVSEEPDQGPEEEV